MSYVSRGPQFIATSVSVSSSADQLFKQVLAVRDRQSVLNAAARSVAGLRRSDHITNTLGDSDIQVTSRPRATVPR